jgi:hypothetical protein
MRSSILRAASHHAASPKERAMPSLPQARPELHQLRFVFESSAPLQRFIPDVTSEDIARIWSAIADRRPDRPVAIEVTFAANPENASGCAPAAMGWLPTHLAWGRDPAK